MGGEQASAVKQALVQIRDLKSRLAEAEAARGEPIAIVGMGLRFPGGANDADSFAELLFEGRDAVREVPADRWNIDEFYSPEPDQPGKMITRFGGFIDDIDQFDADFFGISPLEAARMDPQQRILLEVAWEALENAGIAPASLAGTTAGVYLGISNSDYGRALLGNSDERELYSSTGAAFSVAAGRISYQLGLTGPSVAVDTACSSSLVALHLAAQGLRSSDCDVALAGGINLIVTPEMNIVFSAGRMMAPDGHCKTFDAAADGYVRGEGCGMVVLRRLSDAQRRGDRILGVIRGSAINQDGRSGGLTAPNGPSQEAVIRAALQSARAAPGDIAYVEMHGTGTPLGDPIEAGALINTLCTGRESNLLVGSVKTNLGHLEAAAGIAGVIKVLLAFERDAIPASLHFSEGSPHIDWSRPIEVANSKREWKPGEIPRLAGVSSFGFSGTNAHIMLEAPQPAEAIVEATRPLHLLPLSAREPEGLRKLAAAYREQLTDDAPLAAICATAATGRSHFAHRLAVTGKDAAALRAALDAFLEHGEGAGVHLGQATGEPQTAFLFTGQGAQYKGMARGLYQHDATFRAALDACAAALESHLEAPLIDLIMEETPPIDGAELAQPLTFAVEYALAMLWQHWGIAPAAVAGHSLGAYAAACVAGMMTIEDAAALVAARGRLTEQHALPGAMAAISAPEDAFADLLAGESGTIGIATYNAPANIVISGDTDAVASVSAKAEARGLRVRPLRVRHAAHSPLVDPVVEAFAPVVGKIAFTPNRIAFVSDLTGALASSADVAKPRYWLDHLRNPVRFTEATRTLAALGITHFIETGPHPVLLGMAGETLGAEGGAWHPSLRRDDDDWQVILASLADLYVAGAEIDWQAFHGARAAPPVPLPTYPFKRRRHWVDPRGQNGSSESGKARWQRIERAMQRASNQGPLDLNAQSYPAKWALLSRITAAHAARTLAEGGVFATAGERHTATSAAEAAGIQPTYGRIVSRWLGMLADEDKLVRDGDGFVAEQPLTAPHIDALWAEADTLFADNRPLLDYVRHCGTLVGPVMRGEVSPLETLFPAGRTDIAEGLYERSATMRYINQLAANAVEATAGDRPLRIMEIGGGTGSTGGTTSAVLPVLADGAKYLFTDASDVFFDDYRARLNNERVLFKTFDLEGDLPEQDVTPGSFDLLISANAVHASRDLPAALGRLRELLAGGGMLVLIESTEHLDWFDMSTSLVDGWQPTKDGLREEFPLMASDNWLDALRDAGFDEVSSWPDENSPAAILGQRVILAHVKAELNDADAIGLDHHSEQREVSSEPALTESFLIKLRDAFPDERQSLLRDEIRRAVMRVLHRSAEEVPPGDARLIDLGLDSLMAVRLRGMLCKRLELGALPASLIFDHPTIDALTKHLFAMLPIEKAGEPASAMTSAGDAQADRDSRSDNLADFATSMSDEEIEAILMERLNND